MPTPKPNQTQFLLDSCDHLDTIATQELLNQNSLSLFGQTTNPSLLVKNPLLQTSLQNGKITETELLKFYKSEITKISELLPNGSVSIEVYADQNSTKEELLEQANTLKQWIPNSYIKFPTIASGLAAAKEFVDNGGKVNMTLVFSQEQALAVHLISQNAKNTGDVYLSPFIGRLDDIGINGLDLVANCLKMYQELNSKVWVLGASIRNLEHLETCIAMNCDIVTAPISIYAEYVNSLENKAQKIEVKSTLKSIPYQNLDYSITDYQDLNIQHDLTDQGLTKFVKDWKSVLVD